MGSICTTCGTENAQEAKYCIKCGLGLSIETEQPKKSDEPKRGGVKKVLAIGATVIIILLMALPTTVTVPYQKLEDYQEVYTILEEYEIQVPYDVQETYTERVPYDTTEYYIVSEPYTYSTPVDYTIVSASYSNYWVSPPTTMWVTVTNGDSKSGYFTVQFDITTIGGATKTVWASEYILSQETKEITATSTDKIQTYNYKVTPPQKEVSAYHDVQKTRTITKYQDVSRVKTVTKYRAESRQRDATKSRPAQRYVTAYEQKTVMTIQKILGAY